MHKTEQIKSRVTLSLTADDVVNLLIEKGYLKDSHGNEKVVFHVPGGGDWSHMDVDIDQDNPICVSYEINTTEGPKEC